MERSRTCEGGPEKGVCLKFKIISKSIIELPNNVAYFDIFLGCA